MGLTIKGYLTNLELPVNCAVNYAYTNVIIEGIGATCKTKPGLPVYTEEHIV